MGSPTYLGIIMKEIYHAYEQGYMQAVESIHQKIIALECDEQGKVSFLDVYAIVDNLINQELRQ